MASALRVDRAVREAARLASESLPPPRLFEALLESLGRHGLRFDGACWHLSDPATGLLTTTGVTGDVPGSFALALELELHTADVGKLDELSARRTPVAALHHETGGRPERSPRYRQLLEPDGFADELRVVFTDAFGIWGSLLLFRSHSPFDAAERDLAGRLVPSVSAGLRAALRPGAPRPPATPVPGVLVLDEEDHLELADATARTLLGGVVATPDVPGGVSIVAARARRAGAPARGKMLGCDGWLLLDASPLDGPAPGRLAVVVQAAPPTSLQELRLRAAGLTTREREVARRIVRGEDTAEIAAGLFLSRWTVQDHLKAIFQKLEIGSRRELTTLLLAGAA
jgi:DNA-binding CsgD family transcriptional regulator